MNNNENDQEKSQTNLVNETKSGEETIPKEEKKENTGVDILGIIVIIILLLILFAFMSVAFAFGVNS